MNRIRIVLATALLLIISAAGVRAQSVPLLAAPPSAAFESLKTFYPVSSFESIEPTLPVPAAGRSLETGLTGEQLFQELHKTLAVTNGPVPTYKQAKVYMYSKADNITCNGGPGIMTFYSQICVNGSSSNGNDYHEQGDQNGDGIVDKIVNAEHLWPQSYFNSALPMVADLHQLASTFETPNSRRSNLKFTKVSKPIYSTSSGSKLGVDGFEPADAVKGNVARAMLYFLTRYYDRSIRKGMNYNDFWTLRVPMFLEWNRQDPPDANERRRNDLVETFEGKRNPFIDDPSLADRIGEAVFSAH
ncbi:MAG: hypothetical protein A2270_04410 [Elusimicrobia bacterium RIFOXYA12_FULL_51_18]|nr:MAG: hypothetical protein A2270_04410 [Elusimicrobia bacterium RIFOXYA12_FULL_51_18]OGS30043.1 MAG: hypothetical protein A2218_12915 [Elusimicrobia bacterium RIFOXYA2_FULL_53_38]